MKIDAVRDLFPGLRETIYLNTATMSVGCTPAQDAYARAVERWSAGRFDWTETERAAEDCRSMFAAIVGADSDEIAIVPAVSASAGLVAANLPAGQSGESIVVAEQEFSSNYFPWLLLKERGYEVRTLPATDGVVATDRYAQAADGGTRLIAVSAVQSSTGYRADLPALSGIAKRSGAWLFVDACQAAGAISIDVTRDGVDFLATSSHKFLLGSRGMGYLFVRRPLIDKMRPICPGWKAARKPLESFYGPSMDLSPTASRLDMSLVWFATLAEQASLGLFRQFGVDAITGRNVELSSRLHDALSGSRTAFRPFATAHRSTIVSVAVDDGELAMTRLRAANVVASMRAGRIRLSVHVYNTEAEIDRAAAVLAGRQSS